MGVHTMKRVAMLVYGVFSYAVFLIAILYAIGFAGNIIVPKTIDSGQEVSSTQALLINIALLGLFAIQHTIMARQGFKKWWTKIVPQAVERSTFVLLASLILLLLYYQWQPMKGVIWDMENSSGNLFISGIFWIGWVIVFSSTFMIDHFELFGLRQVYQYLRGQKKQPPRFKTTAFYSFVRHPIMLGLIIAFWAAPLMTVGHLVFAVTTTVYILIGIQFEERDLISAFGDTYKNYRERVPMLLPLPKKK